MIMTIRKSILIFAIIAVASSCKGGSQSPEMDSTHFVLVSDVVRDAMLSHGFKPYDCEWWHFTLADEPFPDTYFNFPVATSSL